MKQNANITMRNTRRVLNRDAEVNRAENTPTLTCQKCEYPKKKIIKYGKDELVIPIPNESDGTAYDAIITPNGMNGTERFFSVPKGADDTACALQKYLEKLKGKNICAALWTNGKNKIEKCGILTDVGSDYISIRENNPKRLIIISMDKVKYISVFCV